MLVMILKSLRLSILYQVELVYLHYLMILGYQWYISSLWCYTFFKKYLQSYEFAEFAFFF